MDTTLHQFSILNQSCLNNPLEANSIDLGIFDPPFGIQENTFDKHYKRDKQFILNGYVEAPEDYHQFSLNWLEEAKRVLKPNGSAYIISGWTHLRHILNALNEHNFEIINHIIWKFNFGVATKKKYVSSHYHILYIKKPNGIPKFNTYCRFGQQERDEKGSLNYRDLEDVFVINKEFNPNETKNKNKLPDALIEKLILYSSDVGDVVCDFFLGNFTTAIVGKKLGRKVVGFEINKESYEHGMQKLAEVEEGCGLKELKVVENKCPANQGKKITEDDIKAIVSDYDGLGDMTKKAKMKFLCEKYGRGRFSITNILDKHYESISLAGRKE